MRTRARKHAHTPARLASHAGVAYVMGDNGRDGQRSELAYLSSLKTMCRGLSSIVRGGNATLDDLTSRSGNNAHGRYTSAKENGVRGVLILPRARVAAVDHAASQDQELTALYAYREAKVRCVPLRCAALRCVGFACVLACLQACGRACAGGGRRENMRCPVLLTAMG